MEKVAIFYDHLEYFTAIWYNSWPFDIVCGYLVYFFTFWYVWTNKKNLANLAWKPDLKKKTRFIEEQWPISFRKRYLKGRQNCLSV
jgi:hypothetical protein